MISAINSFKTNAISQQNTSNMSFKSNDYEERGRVDDLSLMPDSRDLVSNNGVGLYDFINNTRKEVDIALAEQKISMLREKYDATEDGVRKEVLASMIEDAIEDLETIKIHFNVQ